MLELDLRKLSGWKKLSADRVETDVFIPKRLSSIIKVDNLCYPVAGNIGGIDGTFHVFLPDAHLHIYNRLNTGLSLVKEFDLTNSYLKFVEVFSENREEVFFSYIRIIRPALKIHPLLLSLFRLKRTWSDLMVDFDTSFEWFYKNSSNKEVDWLNAELASTPSVAPAPSIAFYLEAMRIRKELRNYNAFPNLIPVIWFVALLLNFTKLFMPIKKFVGFKGPFAVVGCDGSGKSSTLEVVESRFNGMRFQILNYGLPDNSFWERWLNNKIAKKRNFDRSPSVEQHVRSSKNLSLVKDLYFLLLALRRLRVSVWGLFLTKIGYVVFFDRYLNVNWSKSNLPDSPRCSIRFFAWIEKALYRLTPHCMMIFRLEVDSQTALVRNRLRNKPGKETDEDILKRHTENGFCLHKSFNTCKIDGGGNGVDEVVNQILSSIGEISQCPTHP